MNLASLINVCKNNIIKHSPAIMTAFGIVGMGASVIFAVKATPKACQLIEEKQIDTSKPIDIVKCTWRCYIPSAILFVGSAGFLVGSTAASSKRTASIAAAYSLSETAFREYRDHVKEVVSDKDLTAITDSLGRACIEKHPDDDIVDTPYGDSLCVEYLPNHRYFRSNQETIRRVVNDLNAYMISSPGRSVSLNEFYEQLGLEPTPNGDEMGWCHDKNGLIEIAWDSQISQHGNPCLVMIFDNPPILTYDEWL